MTTRERKRFIAAGILACALLIVPALCAHGADVVARVEIDHPGKLQKAHTSNPVNAVLWLNPAPEDNADPVMTRPLRHYQLVQHNKEFNPHLLVVPVGSSVEFPNRDPFYHNVFSLFNGKRFDLGLYESGSSRTVHFDHEGISYIFCNIHPEMGAVVIALKTPYFASATADGEVIIHDVPPGTYELNVWAEGGNPAELNALSRRVQITSAQQDLGLIRIETNGRKMKHKNKFGEDYPRADAPTY